MSKLKIYACSGVGSVDLAKANRVTSDLENAGWQRNETLRKYLGSSDDGGCAEYFLYIFIPDSDLSKYNATIYKKRKQQIKTFEYVRQLFLDHDYGTEAELLDVIRTGIEKTFGTSVESVLFDIRSGKREAVGEPISMAVAMIISAVISLVVAVISGVISYCKEVKVAKYTAPTFQELSDSAPAPEDYKDPSEEDKKEKDKKLTYGLLAGVALLILGTLNDD